ncbi:cation:proton antiporter subunit C [Corynebacterium sp. MSK035]|uniref:sodium:proton antiporter n=1 Tax=Corynebacterium TaxID=1716 RepID=UPI0011CCC25B|nr:MULTISPECIES: cation:proton antiporter subunit C [unclassified Corynebacterium]MBC6747880.1 cation:proton antiporter [Corynebacterium sp. LK25]MBC6793063.1 cation:proton antiporter [Corynebacterium sp. LK26]MDK8811012.1 cation:proton antiporter subunit C [Corynebacterium sp. MSK035]MDK8850855.1 cation:proton antiporter subunit C [Corynebacterium sp. MSK019]TXS59510.1 cation:proton antiporter [Corynebacterium sp. LK19]
MIIAIMAAVLAGGGTYLVLQRGMLRTIIGMTLISHAANLIILSTGVGAWRGEPLLGNETTAGAGAAEQMADPLPQAFVLTAIVITMAVTAFMLALSGLGRDDDTRIHEDREAMRQLSTAGRRAGKHIPADSDSTVTGTPGVTPAPDKFPRETPYGGDEKW